MKIILKNNDSSSKYFALSQSDNDHYWLNLNNSSWGKDSFDKSYQVKVAAKSATSAIEIPNFSGGCRLFVFNSEFQGGAASWGRPDLATEQTLYDKIEGGSPGTAVWNQTSVDFFAIPVQLTLGSNSYGFKSSATASAINAALDALPAPYNKLRHQPHSTSTVVPRFFSPLKGADWLTEFQTWNDSEIPNLLPSVAAYKGFPVKYNNVDYSYSKASGNTIQCNGKTVTLTGKEALQNNYPSNPAGALLATAMLRGVLEKVDDWGNWSTGNENTAADMAKYYQAEPYNSYCKVLHEFGIDGKVYAMPYDDYFHNDASYTPGPNDTLTVTVLPLK